MQLCEAIEALCVATRANGRSQCTVRTYREKLGHLARFLGDVEVESITTNDLRRWIAHMRDREVIYKNHPQHEPQAKPLSEHTVYGRVRHMKRLFNWLVEEGILTANPASRIKVQKPSRDKPKGINQLDFLKLVEATKGQQSLEVRDRAIVLFLYDTGCRVGGLCGLNWGDLDFENRLASVKEKRGKTRLVPLSSVTLNALQAWESCSKLNAQDNPVFSTLRMGQAPSRMTPGSVLQAIRRRAEEIGCTGPVNPHAFRHGFAREFLLDGGDLATLSSLLGHADSKITTDYYAIFTVEELREKHKEHSPIKVLGSCENGESE